MNVVIIADTFPPLRTSGAVQLRDLSREFVRQGHSLTVLLPSSIQNKSWLLEDFEGVQVLRLKSPKTKDVSYVRRTLAELVMPFFMLWQLYKSPFLKEKWDGIIWYSPSIFHGPLVTYLKKKSGCKGYLIIRDIFPQWALDMGLIKRGLFYYFFESIARFQYSVADVIGIQALGNKKYFDSWDKKPGRKIEVLNNWLGESAQVRCSIRVNETKLTGRKIFVYAGNMGVAQGMDSLLNLAERLSNRLDIGFIFVGRGGDVGRLKEIAKAKLLNNVIFFDEIHPDEIPDLYAQCSVGLIALDIRHQSHNIPGKFLTYLQSGLPVLANVNESNDLVQMIRDERIGYVCTDNNTEDLINFIDELLNEIEKDADMPNRCRRLFKREFSAEAAVRQIVVALST